MANIEVVKGLIERVLGEEYEVQVVSVIKNNAKLTGLNIGKVNDRVRPTFYVDEDKTDVWESKRILRLLQEEDGKDKNNFQELVIKVQDWSYAKEIIKVRLIDTNKNEQMKNEGPCTNLLDLLVVPYLEFQIEGEEGMSSIRVTKQLVDIWKLDDEAVVNKAIENSIHEEHEDLDLNKIVMESSEIPFGEIDFSELPTMRVISNPMKQFGLRTLLDRSYLMSLEENMVHM